MQKYHYLKFSFAQILFSVTELKGMGAMYRKKSKVTECQQVKFVKFPCH